MTKYIVEDNIDFFREIKNNKNTEVDTINVCLITGEKLTDKSETLSCGHSFNYEPLFYDVLNHKKKFNSMERRALRCLEIRCPYCRNIQRKLLPYYEDLGFEKIHGVNFYDETNNNHIKSDKISNPSYIGVCAYEATNVCNFTLVTMVESLGKPYCSYHKYMALQEHAKKQKKEIKDKAKAEKNAIIEAAKQVAKAKKILEKAEIPLCKELIKKGKNVGKECSCKVFQEGKCKRHSLLLK